MLIRPGVVDFRGRDLGRQSYGSPRQIVSETCTEWRLLRMQSTISVDVRVEEKEEHQKLKDGSAVLLRNYKGNGILYIHAMHF